MLHNPKFNPLNKFKGLLHPNTHIQPVQGASTVMGGSPHELQQAQELNEVYPISQSFNIQCSANTQVSQRLVLTAPAQAILGVNITSDVSMAGLFLTLSVNNYSFIINAAAKTYDPTQIHSVNFFQAIQKLLGQDTIQATINNSSGSTPLVTVALLYVPQSGKSN